MPDIDFAVYDGGSVVLIKPVSAAAITWANEHVQSECFFASSVPVERRFVYDLCRGILADGLSIAKDGHFVLERDGELVLGDPVSKAISS